LSNGFDFGAAVAALNGEDVDAIPDRIDLETDNDSVST